MQNLIPLESYLRDETGYWTRLPFVSGTFFGVTFSTFFYFAERGSGTLLHPPTFVHSLVTAVLSGVFFGALFTFFLRRKVKRLWKLLYLGNAAVESRFSKQTGCTHKLVCTLVQEDTGIGGTLYLGSDNWQFLPHQEYGQKERSSDKKLFQPATSIHLALIRSPESKGLIRRWLQKFLVPKRPMLLDITSSGAHASFLVPTPEVTLSALHDVIVDE